MNGTETNRQTSPCENFHSGLYSEALRIVAQIHGSIHVLLKDRVSNSVVEDFAADDDRDPTALHRQNTFFGT